MTCRKSKLIFALTALMFILTSCGKSGDTDVSPDSVFGWVAEFYTPILSIAPTSARSDGEYVYFSTTGAGGYTYNRETGEYESSGKATITEYYRWKIGSEEPENLELNALPQVSSDIMVAPDGKGNVYVCYYNCIVKYDSNGEELFRQAIDTSATSLAVDSEGHLYVLFPELYGGKLCMYNSDCTLNTEIETSGNFITTARDGSVYMTTSLSDPDIAKLNFGDPNPEIVYKNCGIYDSFVAYLDKGFLTSSGSGLYLYNTETECLEELFMWANLGINYSDVRSYCVLDDGSIVAFVGGNDTLLSGIAADTTDYVVHISQKEAANKEVITVGTFTSSTALTSSVAEFNRNSEDYVIEIKQYYDWVTDNSIGGTGYNDAVTRFHLDIVSGDCPDIICLDYDDLETYAKQDLFEDLKPYIEASGLEIMSNVSEAYTFYDKLVAIPPEVKLRLFAASSDNVGESDGVVSWTLDEMMDYINEHSDESVFDVGALKMLEYCITLNQNRFVDKENGTCSFQSDEFYELLEFCMAYNGGDDSINNYPSINIGKHDAEIYEVGLATPSDYLILQQIFDSEDITFFGFPTDNSTGILIEELNGSYAISSISEHKDAAWSFIESIITNVPNYELVSTRNGYPTDKNTREEYFTEVMSEPYTKRGILDTADNRRDVGIDMVGDKICRYYIPFEEELEPIINLLENAHVAVDNDSTILDIILENAEEYFSGEKSVEDVAKQIQSRVTIYINETK